MFRLTFALGLFAASPALAQETAAGVPDATVGVRLERITLAAGIDRAAGSSTASRTDPRGGIETDSESSFHSLGFAPSVAYHLYGALAGRPYLDVF